MPRPLLTPPSFRDVRLLRLSLLLALGVALLAPAAHAQRNGQITITYEKVDGDASVAVIEMRGRAGERVPPFEAGPGIALLTVGTERPDTWTASEWRLRDGAAVTRATIPAPDQIVAILVPAQGGGWTGWNIEQGSASRWNIEQGSASRWNVAWTVLAAKGEEEPEETPEEEPCTAGSCTGIVDPWTCECQEDIRDPWESEVRRDAIMLRF